jgi:hypothetical protein
LLRGAQERDKPRTPKHDGALFEAVKPVFQIVGILTIQPVRAAGEPYGKTTQFGIAAYAVSFRQIGIP